jgi:hypothetical protein
MLTQREQRLLLLCFAGIITCVAAAQENYFANLCKLVLISEMKFCPRLRCCIFVILLRLQIRTKLSFALALVACLLVYTSAFLLFLLDYKSERNEQQMAAPKAREANGSAKSKGCCASGVG